MGLFKSNPERDLKKSMSREKHARYKGISMQAVGQIPADVVVGLSLDPEREVLCIEYKSVEITLPYDRISSFTIMLASEDISHKVLKSAQSFLENADAAPSGLDPFGAKKILTGLASNVASNLIPQNKIMYAISTLAYIDKSGIPQQLKFYNKEETGYGINNADYHDREAEHFAEVINAMKGRRSESITEL